MWTLQIYVRFTTNKKKEWIAVFPCIFFTCGVVQSFWQQLKNNFYFIYEYYNLILSYIIIFFCHLKHLFKKFFT